jgi:hypothetical protein
LEGCDRQADTADHANEFIVLQGATDVHTSHEGSGSIRYTVRAPFPASEVRAELADTLEARGWKRTDHDPVFPDVDATESFHDVRYRSASIGKRLVVGWTNPQGDVHGYELLYPKFNDPQHRDELTIFGFYLTPHDIQLQREFFKAQESQFTK